MIVDSKLNLVLPLDVVRGGKTEMMYVHCTPISREVFDRYFLVLSKTYASILREGLGWSVGAAVAYKMLKKVSQDDDAWDDKNGSVGVKRGLAAEIVRLSNVLASTPGGWEMVPLEVAQTQGYLSEDDHEEVLNAATFFTLASRVMMKRHWDEIRLEFAGLWGGKITSLDCGEFSRSSEMSTGTGTS